MVTTQADSPGASSTSGTSRPSRHDAFVLALLLHLAALIFYYFAVLRLDYEKTTLLNLGPYPDAAEYFAQAKAITTDGKPSIQIGHDKLPSRFPPGYPVLMLPWLKLLSPGSEILAPFRTNQTIGLLLLLSVFAFYVGRRKPIAGGSASLLLATSPAFVTFSRSSLSEISGASAVVLAFILVYLGLEDKRRWQIYLAAVVLGLAFSIRSQLVFFAPLLLGMALFPGNYSRTTWLFHCSAVIIVFALAMVPMFILNTMQFGHPLKTGYNFWVPSVIERRLPFSFRNISRHAWMLWSDFTLQWRDYRVGNLFGTGTYFVPAFALLTAVGLFFMRRGRFQTCSILAGASFLLATATFLFVEVRLYFPLLVLFVAVATLPVEWALRMIARRRRNYAAVALLCLFVLALIGYPSKSGYRPKSNRSQAWDIVHLVGLGHRSDLVEAEKFFMLWCGREPGIVLSDIDPVYLNALLPDPFVAAPLDATHHYAFSKLWHYGTAEASALVREGLAKQLPIYGLFAPVKRPNLNISRLPAIEGYLWITIANSKSQGVIMELTPVPTT